MAFALDVISFNRYNAWYHESGHLDMITDFVVAEATEWHTQHNKPVLMSEYGADTMEGLHFVSMLMQKQRIHKLNVPR